MNEMTLPDEIWDLDDTEGEDSWGIRAAVWAVRAALVFWCLPAIVLAVVVTGVGVLISHIVGWVECAWEAMPRVGAGQLAGVAVPSEPYFVRRNRTARLQPHIARRSGRGVR
jgi:hypothetical protein